MPLRGGEPPLTDYYSLDIIITISLQRNCERSRKMRNKTVTLRLTDEEFEKLMALAKKLGMNKNQYLRYLVLKQDNEENE